MRYLSVILASMFLSLFWACDATPVNSAAVDANAQASGDGTFVIDVFGTPFVRGCDQDVCVDDMDCHMRWSNGVYAGALRCRYLPVGSEVCGTPQYQCTPDCDVVDGVDTCDTTIGWQCNMDTHKCECNGPNDCQRPVLGDGRCDFTFGENMQTAPQDCGACGDGFCYGNELFTCPQDCSYGWVCGDGICDTPEKMLNSCPEDCNLCGDDNCSPGEEYDCPEDCGQKAECGNLHCESGETLNSCPQDCNYCGDQFCFGYEFVTCPQDCGGGGGSVCGNLFCDDDETVDDCVIDCNRCGDGVCYGDDITTCPEDCQNRCGNGSCDPNETAFTCPEDCQEGPVQSCGNGVCEGNESSSCPQDCPDDEPWIGIPMQVLVCYDPDMLAQMVQFYKIWGQIAWSSGNSGPSDWSQDLGHDLPIDANGCFKVTVQYVCKGYWVDVTVGKIINNAEGSWMGQSIKPISATVTLGDGQQFTHTTFEWIPNRGWFFGPYYNMAGCVNTSAN